MCGCSTILASLEKNSTWSWYLILLVYCWICFLILLKILASYIHQGYTVQFSCTVMSNSLGPHGLQHTRLPCSSLTPRVWSNSYPSSWWCHPAISSSVVPFSSHFQSFPASGSFPVSQFFELGGQKYWSLSFSISPSNEYSGLISLMDWLDLLVVQGTLKSLLQHHSSKTSFLKHSAFFIV